MKLISRDVFNKMDKLGFVGHKKANKSYYISSAKKKSRRKKIYICEKNYNDFLKNLEDNKNKK